MKTRVVRNRVKTCVIGYVVDRLFGPDGRLKFHRIIRNTIPAVGLAWMAKCIAGEAHNAISHVAVGTGTPGATALGAEAARVAVDSVTRSGAGVTVTATFGPGVATGTLTEAGIFDAGAAGTMIASQSFAATPKGAADTLVRNWTITHAAA